MFPALSARRGCVFWGIVINASILLFIAIAALVVAVM
jgi:hypothetical protein